MIDKNEPADQKQEFNHSSCMHNEEFLRNQVMQDFTRITELEADEVFFSEFVEWQKSKFPHSTALSKVAHLAEEVDELSQAIKNGDPDRRLEFADCILLLVGAAAADGMTFRDLVNAAREKMEINRSRKWGEPDENGVVKHIKD